MKKFFSLLTLALLTMSVGATNYVKVTSTSDIVSGTYLIVFEDSALIFNGGLETLDAVSNTIAVTITNGTIESTTEIDAATFTINVTDGTLKSASGYYIGQTSDANGLKASTSTQYANAFAIDEDGNADIVSSSTHLRYNTASNQKRFRYYKSASYTGQKAIQLYKLEGEAPVVTTAAPSIPASQSFTESITVDITNNAEGATVYYSTDNATWTEYTQSLTFTETTTLYAKAVLDEVESSVVSATYTKIENICATLAAVNALDDGTDFNFTGNAVVTAQQGKYLWLRDETGYGLIYATLSSTFTNGQVLNPSWTATKTSFKGLTEYTDPANVSASENTNAELAAAQEITALSDGLINAYGYVNNVVFTTISGRNVTATLSDGSTMVMYNTFDLTLPSDNAEYNVTGVVSKYNSLQFIILTIEAVPSDVATPVISPESCTFIGSQVVTITCETADAAIYYSINDAEAVLYEAPFTLTETAEISAYAVVGESQSATATANYTKRAEVSTIAEANALANKTDFVFYGNVVVVYQNGSNLWVKDDSGYGLIYQYGLDTFAEGTTLEEEWEAQHYIFRGMIHEYQNAANVTATDAELVTITPTEYTALDTTNINERVIMKGLTLIAETDTTVNNYAKYLYNAADSMAIFNQFGIEYPTELEGKTFDVEGMVSYYGGKVQIMPIAITESATAGLRGDVNGNGDVNIEDVTALIDYLLSGDATGINLTNADCDLNGDINISDVTVLIDYLLNGAW